MSPVHKKLKPRLDLQNYKIADIFVDTGFKKQAETTQVKNLVTQQKILKKIFPKINDAKMTVSL